MHDAPVSEPHVRGLLIFWMLVLLLLGGGAGVLEWLGPPTSGHVLATRVQAAPKPADPTGPAALLPRIPADGRRPMQFYAAASHVAPGTHEVALLIDGIGLSLSGSQAAISQLPAAVSFAFSPYAADPQALAEAARAAGHELLISIPLEPEGYPLSDEGARALLTGNQPGKNLINMEWALSRIQGYVGATSGLDGMRGEQFLRAEDLFGSLQDELNKRGLMFIDARPGSAAPDRVPGRGVDVVIDDPDDPASIDAKLAALVAQAQARGSALGLAGPLRPVTLAHLKAWIAGLPAQHLSLVPVSALVGS